MKNQHVKKSPLPPLYTKGGNRSTNSAASPLSLGRGSLRMKTSLLILRSSYGQLYDDKCAFSRLADYGNGPLMFLNDLERNR